jgi:endonuclease III
MDQQMKVELVWKIPYEIQQRLGTFSFRSLAALKFPEVRHVISNPSKLHRYPGRMARFVYSAIQRIRHVYRGDASRIWRGKPSSADVVRRFLAFDGVGPKIATMAANILAREFKVPMSDYNSIDISVDRHVRRVFTRLRLVDRYASVEQLTYTARAFVPEFPGLLDLPAFEIGKKWCRPKQPACPDCYMVGVCPSARAGAA